MRNRNQDRQYSTTHTGLASFLRYIGVPHIMTDATTRPPHFVFANDGTCAGLSKEFFSEESVQIGNARELLETARALRNTVARANDAGGVWVGVTEDGENEP